MPEHDEEHQPAEQPNQQPTEDTAPLAPPASATWEVPSSGAAQGGGAPPSGGAPPGGGAHPGAPGSPYAKKVRRLTIVGATVAFGAAAVFAGSIGYAAGTHRGAHGPNRFFEFPGGQQRPVAPQDGGFVWPFGQNPFGDDTPFPGGRPVLPGKGQGNGTTSANVPAAVRSSEASVVDVNSTLGGGGQSSGTGIILSEDGYVLTNNHVVDGATSVKAVTVTDGTAYAATVVGYDLRDDVALLKLSGASGLTAAAISSTPAAVGQRVWAVGNAQGLGGTPTVTSGSITRVDQTITAGDASNGSSETLHGLLETDAALISGDSGGPLTNAKGEVLGVDTATSAHHYVGARGYAIPIAAAMAIAHQILSGTTTARVHVGPSALLGVRISSSGKSTGGARVLSVPASGPAAAAGITAGSRVTSIGGEQVSGTESLRVAMSHHHPGDTVRVDWLDARGITHHASVTLATGPTQ